MTESKSGVQRGVSVQFASCKRAEIIRRGWTSQPPLPPLSMLLHSDVMRKLLVARKEMVQDVLTVCSKFEVC